MRATAKYVRDSKTIIVNFPDQWSNADIADLSAAKINAGTLTITSAMGITLEAGGDIHLQPSDTDPSIIDWDTGTTIYQLGAAVTLARGLCIWPDTINTGRFRIGFDPVNNTNKYFEQIDISAYATVYTRAYYDADNNAYYMCAADSDSGIHTWVSEESGTTRTLSFYASASSLIPTGAGLIDLGNDTNYWGDVNYKTLDDRGCLGWFEDGIELQDGRMVSDLEALRQIRMHPTKKTIFGLPMLDYRTLPKPIYRRAGEKCLKNWSYIRDENDEPWAIDPKGNKIKAEDGAELTSLVSWMLGILKELDLRHNKKIKQLRNDIDNLLETA